MSFRASCLAFRLQRLELLIFPEAILGALAVVGAGLGTFVVARRRPLHPTG